MEKESMLKTALFAVLMLLFPMGYSFRMQAVPSAPRPLCASQLALVNRVCALLPYSPGPPDSPPGQNAEPPGPPPPPPATPSAEDKVRHGGHERHRHGHERHGHGHVRHRHHHRREVHHVKTTIESECCRWLAQVDDECVCSMLVRLPPFLARPVHEYTVIVADSCSITYDCASSIIP